MNIKEFVSKNIAGLMITAGYGPLLCLMAVAGYRDYMSIQDRVSEPYPDKVVDSKYSSRIGLPMHTLYDMSKKEMCDLGSEDGIHADFSQKSGCKPFAGLNAYEAGAMKDALVTLSQNDGGDGGEQRYVENLQPGQILSAGFYWNTGNTYTLYDLNKDEICMLGAKDHTRKSDILNKTDCTPFSAATPRAIARKNAAIAKALKV